jgi:hypothetical protein
MKNGISRRGFIGTSFVLGMLGPGCMTNAFGAKRWYKGNLHMHSFWSDGRAAPEEAIELYKSRGWDFVALSDHNVFQDNPEEWVSAGSASSRRYKIGEVDLKRYLKSFPDAETRKAPDGNLQVRLKTFNELCAIFDEPGKFLLIPAVEATRSSRFDKGDTYQLHMNYINLPELLPSYRRKDFTRTLPNKNVSEFLRENVRETSEVGKKLGRKHLFILNHPIWRWYDVGPEELIENPEVRFFEVCNNGSPFAPGKGLPQDGFDTDRLWDVVNAFRARRGQPLLYGVGTDDTHYYNNEPGKMCMPGNAWTKVRACSLDADDIIDAMYDGDFQACEMLEFDDILFDKTLGKLEVCVGASAGVSRTVKFIVTKKDFSEKPVGSLTLRPAEKSDSTVFERTIDIYDAKIGLVAKTVKGTVGECVKASYTLQDDDLYVRARVEESAQPLCTAYLHPQGKHVAWTQPYRK